MNTINIAQTIIELRKKKGITQEQLATALNISPQAVSKWETSTSQPDILTLPLIASFFDVSIDYLFYGKQMTYDEIYDKVFQKVCNAPDQMCKKSYEDALKIFGFAHHGISKGNLRGKNYIYDTPSHISNENGISVLSGKGYGAIITRDFFENISKDTADFAEPLLLALSNRNQLLACMAIISMSDISFKELQEKLKFDENTLRFALSQLIEAKLVIEKKSKHKSLGYTYEISEIYHSFLCILIATLEMQRYTLQDISCCMGFGDYPIKL